MNKKIFRLVHPLARKGAADFAMTIDDGWIAEFKPATRTTDQNSKLWPMLDDVSKQVEWYGRKLSTDDWKHIFSASLKKQEAVPGIDGGIVVLGQSTSNLSKRDFADLIEIIYAFGAQHNVQWTERQAA